MYEAATEIDDVGAGVTVYGRSFDIIAALGDELKAELERVGDVSQCEFQDLHSLTNGMLIVFSFGFRLHEDGRW